MDLYELGISTHQVFNAYKKLKHYFFYDSSTLFVRQKIADFEDDFFKDGNKDDINHIKNKLFNRVNDVFKKIVLNNFPENELEIISLPKKIKDNKSDLTTNSNRNAEGVEIEDFYYFINPSVEVHILSTLWVMYAGRFLNCDLSESCYANKLDLNVDLEYEEPYENLKLFKPYFIQYQNWRDDAITKAESLLDEQKDVCILSLDIKDYYHSINISFESLKENIEINIQKYFKHKNLNDYKDKNLKISLKLTDILLKIHEDYLKKLLIVKQDSKNRIENRYPLPIGLLSSCFLGNYFLKEFDQMVVENINPAFYGRYVDDLMFVFSDLQIKDDKIEISPTLKFLYDNFYKKDVFNIVESDSRDQLFCLDSAGRFILKKSSSISDLIDKCKEESSCKYKPFIKEEHIIKEIIDSLTFSFKNPYSPHCSDDSFNVKDLGYEKLIIKTSKTVLHFLKHNESRAVLNIFKKKLEKQRSEFRFLPDEDEISEQFDEEAFNLKYNDSENKFRSIEDFSENKYGASKFLAKKIFAVSFGDKKEDDEVTDKQILTFFKESTGLKFYSLWEKVATYFVLRNSPENLIKFKRNIEFAISKANNIKNNYLKSFLDSSLAISLSLNPKLEFKFLDAKERTELSDIFKLVIKFRQSNLFRVSLISIPGINFTNYIHTQNNLVNNDFNRCFENKKDDIKLDNLLCFLSPYYVPFHECNILKIISVVSTLSEDDVINTEIIESTEQKLSNEDEFENDEDSLLDDNNLTQAKANHLEDIDHKIDKINNIPNDAFVWYFKCNYDWKVRKKKINEIKDKYFKITSHPIEFNGSLKNYEVEVLGEKEDTINSDLIVKENKRIALANIKIDNSNVEKSYLGKPNLSKNRRKTIFRLLNEADELKSDMIIFPEVSIPYSWLRLLVERSHKRYMGIVAGLEHWINLNNIAFNFMVTILPFKIHDNTTSLIKIRLKNHYSPYEKHLLTGYRLLIPKDTLKNYKMSYDLFHWRNSYFSVYNCFELADIYHRSLFKSKVDFIVASELNKDTQYFSDIAGAWVRDVHSYFIQVNSSNYGDSRLIQPAGSFRKDLIQVKGGINSAVLVGDLDIKKIREFQFMEYHLQKDNIENGKYDFKPTPPDFDKKNVKIRIENKSFSNG